MLSELFSQALFHLESFLHWYDSEGLKSTAGPGYVFLMDHGLCGKCLFLDVSQPSGSLLGWASLLRTKMLHNKVVPPNVQCNHVFFLIIS